jgi:aspartyl-tRNA(Asn)/glutamyl-tRNA(Gln) amidotransferase subunit B
MIGRQARNAIGNAFVRQVSLRSGSCVVAQTRWLATQISTPQDEPTSIPIRQQLKQQAKLKNKRKSTSGLEIDDGSWELTVGIEIHAALNSERKLFSSAGTSINQAPNSQAALFDLAYPGTQPTFQLATLLPALRAAIALNCEIQQKSTFDRKHYFYPDQPAGYQITQFYEPFAKNGSIKLFKHDGISPEDGDSIIIGIKQIQMEQDTAKSMVGANAEETLLDFNRVSYPLIEIISLPQIHHPATAAAYVRKVQRILRSVGAVTAGMEVGGLRADVNVSVKNTENGLHDQGQSYAGITGLGQRTEIKNLGSIKAVEDAVTSEKSRQIEILNGGGTVDGETRGWTIGGSETHKLRDKEGEVDYRYMPDPDIAPLILSKDLIEHLQNTMPKSQDQILEDLTKRFGLTSKDALTLINLDNGDRLEYYHDTLCKLENIGGVKAQGVGRMVGNW